MYASSKIKLVFETANQNVDLRIKFSSQKSGTKKGDLFLSSTAMLNARIFVHTIVNPNQDVDYVVTERFHRVNETQGYHCTPAKKLHTVVNKMCIIEGY